MCVCVCVCVCECACVCMCVRALWGRKVDEIKRQRQREIERDKYREKDRAAMATAGFPPPLHPGPVDVSVRSEDLECWTHLNPCVVAYRM